MSSRWEGVHYYSTREKGEWVGHVGMPASKYEGLVDENDRLNQIAQEQAKNIEELRKEVAMLTRVLGRDLVSVELRDGLHVCGSLRFSAHCEIAEAAFTSLNKGATLAMIRECQDRLGHHLSRIIAEGPHRAEPGSRRFALPTKFRGFRGPNNLEDGRA